MRWERKDWLIFVLTNVAFLWPFVSWGIGWERILIFGFGSGSCLVSTERVCILFGSFNKMLSYAERPRCLQRGLSVRYNFGQKWKTGTGRQYFKDIMGLSSSTVI